MDTFKKYWKPIAAGLGVSALAMLTYNLFKKNSRIKFSHKLGLTHQAELTPLTKQEAMKRSANVKNVKYTLFLQLRSESILATKNVYEGSTLVEFDLNQIEEVFLDFVGEIKQLTVNGETIHIDHHDGKIILPKSKLITQGNKVFVYYVNHYANDSHGIRHYIDPEDENPYIYTQFEPFYAHTMFPCFDQPNIKATIKLFVSCSKDWKVISATNVMNTTNGKESILTKEEEIKSAYSLSTLPAVRDSFALHEFNTTSVIPVYTFAICAGAFAEENDFSYNKDDKLPMFNIYCRASYLKQLDSFNIFKTAKLALGWFKEHFSVAPENKYDFVFVPGLKMIAMENYGCITFDDKFLDPTQTSIKNSYFHYLIVHELVHTWFGNSVTPEWWDDLWLNEAFATFLSYLCLKQLADRSPDEMGEFSNIWLLFNKQKAKGIIYDQFRTTHKVRDNVEDTAHSSVIFDQITYYKGASILRYFYNLTGHEVFFEVLDTYLKKYNGRTANYDQFKESILNVLNVRNANKDFEIFESFLNNTGVIRLDREIKENNNRIEEFIFTQHPCFNATHEKYYTFKMNALLIYNDREVIINDIIIPDKQTGRISELENIEKPNAIILNYGDWAYLQQSFDEPSKDYLLENTYKIKDSQTRLLISRDLSQMIREGQIDVQTYVKFAINLLKHETEEHIVIQVLKTAIHAVQHFIIYDDQEKLKESLFELIREDLLFKHKGVRKTLINFLIDLINFSNNKEIAYLINFLKSDKENKPSLLRGDSEILDNVDLVSRFDLSYMDEATKVRLLETIAESSVLSKEEKKQYEEIITSIDIISSRTTSPNNSQFDLRKLDVSKNLLTCNKLEKLTLDACQPNKALKESLWEMFVRKDAQLLDDEYAAYMKGFARKSQYKMLKHFFKRRFFEDLIYVKNYYGENYALIFFNNLNPSFIICEKVLKSFIDISKKIGPKDYRLRDAIEKVISKLQLDIKVAKKSKAKNWAKTHGHNQ